MPEETSDQQYCSSSDIQRLTQQQNGKTLIHVNIRSLQKKLLKARTISAGTQNHSKLYIFV